MNDDAELGRLRAENARLKKAIRVASEGYYHLGNKGCEADARVADRFAALVRKALTVTGEEVPAL